MDIVCEKEREVKDSSKVFSVITWKMTLSLTEMGNTEKIKS